MFISLIASFLSFIMLGCMTAGLIMAAVYFKKARTPAKEAPLEATDQHPTLEPLTERAAASQSEDAILGEVIDTLSNLKNKPEYEELSAALDVLRALKKNRESRPILEDLPTDKRPPNVVDRTLE